MVTIFSSLHFELLRPNCSLGFGFDDVRGRLHFLTTLLIKGLIYLLSSYLTNQLPKSRNRHSGSMGLVSLPTVINKYLGFRNNQGS